MGVITKLFISIRQGFKDGLFGNFKSFNLCKYISFFTLFMPEIKKDNSVFNTKASNDCFFSKFLKIFVLFILSYYTKSTKNRFNTTQQHQIPTKFFIKFFRHFQHFFRISLHLTLKEHEKANSNKKINQITDCIGKPTL